MPKKNKRLSQASKWGKTGKGLPLRLRTKLLITYILLITLLFGLFTAFTYIRIKTYSSEQLQEAAGHVLNQTRDLLNYKFSNIIYASDRLFFNASMNEIIKRDMDLPIGVQLLEDMKEIRDIISGAYHADDMYRLSLYLDPSIYYAGTSKTAGSAKARFLNMQLAKEEAWYHDLENMTGKVLWAKTRPAPAESPQDLRLISCIRFIRDINVYNYTKIIGILKIDILQSDIDGIVQNALATGDGVAYLVNSAGTIMAASDEERAQSLNAHLDLAKHVSRDTEFWWSALLDKTEMLVCAVPIEHTDWTLVSLLPYADVQIAGWQIISATLPVLIALVLIAFVFSIVSSHTITKRINHLSKKMMTIRDQALPETMEVEGTDEIAMLIKNYNYMIGRIRQFSEMQYKLGRDVKNAELKALQAQIDPHFLYNTLELVNWMALRNSAPQISSVVQDLAKYYKLSLNKGKDSVSVRDAIEHIQTYISLQNFRFKDRITLVVDVDEELYRYSILNLILQPIVENAIVHGIFEKDSQTGTITIKGERRDDALVLSVTDDGVGMDAETVERFFGDGAAEAHGYGVANVNNRLKLFYGNAYGLRCQSNLGQGTTVEIRFPAIQPE